MEIIPTMSKETNVRQNIPILIAAESNRMRDGLEALLKTRPRINIIGQVDNSTSVLRTIVEHHPVLVLLDTNLPNGQTWPALLEQIKLTWPQTRCLVLADTTRQQQTAKMMGADAVLMKGFAVEKLFVVIERLSSQ